MFLAVKRQELKERDFCFSTPAMLLDLCLCSDKKAGAAPSDYIMVRACMECTQCMSIYMQIDTCSIKPRRRKVPA